MTLARFQITALRDGEVPFGRVLLIGLDDARGILPAVLERAPLNGIEEADDVVALGGIVEAGHLLERLAAHLLVLVGVPLPQTLDWP